MNEAELTWNRSMRVWWLIVWRTMVGCVVLGAIVGAVLGIIIALFQIPAAAVGTGIVSGILGLFISVVWTACVVRMALKKHYSDFRFVLAPNP